MPRRRTRGGRTGLAGFVVLASLLAVVGTARAATSYVQVGEVPGFEPVVGGVAVDNSSGDFYVADGARAVVDKYDASGAFVSSFGEPGSGEGQFGQGFFSGPAGVAVDQSNGNVYVVDRVNDRIERFDSSGKFLSQFDGSATPAGSFSFPSSVAVDPTDGDVYVVDNGNDVVDKFDSSGTVVTAFGTNGSLGGPPGSGFEFPGTIEPSAGLAVDSSGRLYVGDPRNEVVDEFNSAGEYEGKLGAGTLSMPSALTVDSSNDVFVADSSSQSIVELDAAGTRLLSFPANMPGSPHGVAVAGDASHVYLSVLGPGFFENGQVLIFARVTVPDVSTTPALEVQQTSARLEGTVNPDGVQLTDCDFAYTDQADFETNGYSGPDSKTSPCVPDAASMPPDSSDHTVTADVTGLSPNTTYHFRLVAANASGSNQSEDRTFTTQGPPVITSTSVSDVTATEAVLNGQINPEHFDTSYHFEYGTTAAYGASAPVPDADLGVTSLEQRVRVPITGLTPDTTYHFRLVAHSAQGTTDGPDRTFTTYAGPVTSSGCPNERLREENNSTALPDCRAYELVTPNEKDGNEIGVPKDEVQAAVAANGQIVYATDSLSGFGDATNGLGGQFLATRASSGWESTSVLLPTVEHPELFDLDNPVGASSDFSRIFYQTSAALDPRDQNGVTDVYAHNADGSVSWISQGGATATAPIASEFEGTSSDGTHALFQTKQSLTQASQPLVAGAELYDRVGETTVPVGLRSDGSLTSACGAIAGSGARSAAPGEASHTNWHAISSDGSRIFFESPDPNGNGDASCSPQRGGGQPVELYLRQDAATTEVSLSRRTGSVGSPAPDGVTYQGASTAGSRVLFTSPDLLTDDAELQPGELEALYAYDLASAKLTFVAAGSPLFAQDGRPMISDDGSHVYLLGSVPGSGPAGENLYLWDEGAITYISSVPTENNEDDVGLDARVASDGSALVFTSASNLTDYDSHGHTEIYLYRVGGGGVVCISCDRTNSIVPSAELAPSLDAHGGGLDSFNQSITSDGAMVFFQTPTPLAASDTNLGANPSCRVTSRGDVPTTGCDVYEWKEGSVRLLSSGTGGSSRLVGVSSDGTDVIINTGNELTPQDHDGGYGNLFDARVDGGFPVAAERVPCGGESCRPPGTKSATEQLPGSLTFLGPGNAGPTAPAGGHVTVIHKRAKGRSLVLTVSIPTSGRLTITGAGLRKVSRSISKPGAYRLVVPLTKPESHLLRRRRKLTLRASVTFVPVAGRPSSMAVSVTVKA
jgi:DNA-binding beta-propeller fold protein YncE